MIRFRCTIDFDREDEYLSPLTRVRRELAERGIVFDRDRGDFAVADARSMPADGPPMVLLDRNDGGFLWWLFKPRGDIARRCLLSERILGLVKVSRYTDLSHYNELAADERVHASRILRTCPDSTASIQSPPGLPLDANAYGKLLLGPGFWAFDACGPQVDPPPDLDAVRPLDVFCGVTVDYACPAISWHRRQALHRLNGLGRRVFLGRGRVLPPPVYHELMRRSRICVSPWGLGETCHRDYEALLAGCVLIKPRTDFVDSLLPLDECHYVACEPDFSDLRERVEEVLQSWPSYRERRARARDYVLDARRPDWLADRWAETFRAAVRTYQ